MRSEEKWNFFPSWTGSSFFRPTSTYWELAATTGMRNPPNKIEIATEQELTCILFECARGGDGAGRNSERKREKKYFCFSNRLFLSKRGYVMNFQEIGSRRLDYSLFPYFIRIAVNRKHWREIGRERQFSEERTLKVILCTSGMIPAIFGAEGGGRPGRGK